MTDRDDPIWTNGDPEEFPGLTDDDAQALDALIEAGYELDAVPGDMRDRAERVAGLLGLLEAAGDANPLLSSATSVRAPRAAMALDPGPGDPRLTAPDTDAFEALIESGWDASKTPSLFRKRAERIAALLSLLDPPLVAPRAEDAGAGDLVERTFRVVELARAKERREAAELPRIRSRYSLRDIVAVAAMFLVACSIGWPLITNLREGVRQTECAQNMSAAGLGFSLYANDHKGQLPTARQTLSATPPGAWWNVGESRSNSANLFVLANEGYCTLGHLACPGNHAAPTGLNPEEHTDWRRPEEVSFSYLITGPRIQRWDGPVRVVVLADRSPVIERARIGEAFDPDAGSRNHRGRGENALFNDGSVVWLVSPVLGNGDNIWLPASLEGHGAMRLRGTERPSRDNDSFVGP
ncbi:MAG: hypothetical protein H6813_02050 [Phycisphaeraceae bacterium]|nr:hypothetical protein [Phycisphaeraceae bacterium]